AAVATAAAVAATITAATEAPTVLAGSHRLGFVDGERTAFVLLAVELADRLLRLFVRRHLDEAEAFAAAGVTVRDDARRFHGAALGEQIAEGLFGGGERKVTDVQF